MRDDAPSEIVDWSHLSQDGQAAPTVAEAIAEKIDRLRRHRAANPTEARKAKVRLQRETIPSQGISPRERVASGHAPPQLDAPTVGQLIELAGSIQRAFPLLIPVKPSCADYFPCRPDIRSRKHALRRRHIQLNSPPLVTWVAFDIDRSGAYYAADEANLPAPNFVAVNRDNGHAHIAYLLKTPVQKFPGSREAPLYYLADTQRGMRRRLGADPSYCGRFTKNPFSRDWSVDWQALHAYDIGDLAGELSKHDMRPEPKREQASGLSRNCGVFDDARKFAYENVMAFKRAGRSIEDWTARCIKIAGGHNSGLDWPMAPGEVRDIGKSIAKWTWGHFTEAAFSHIQTLRVKRRWAGHEAASTTQPWKALGISRATHYRKKKRAKHGAGHMTPPTPKHWETMGLSRATYFRRKKAAAASAGST